jgi:Ribosomal protein L7/L12 C-terminal domain
LPKSNALGGNLAVHGDGVWITDWIHRGRSIRRRRAADVEPLGSCFNGFMFTDDKALSRLSRQVAELDRKLDLILASLGLAAPQPEYADVVEHLRAGNKIQAIKAFREATGAGLADAKNEVDAMARRMGLR